MNKNPNILLVHGVFLGPSPAGIVFPNRYR
jgi:hypothetical protein